MKAIIDRSDCISCGVCPSICPEVFAMADDDLAEVIVDEIPDDSLENAKQAEEECPVGIITIE